MSGVATLRRVYRSCLIVHVGCGYIRSTSLKKLCITVLVNHFGSGFCGGDATTENLERFCMSAVASAEMVVGLHFFFKYNLHVRMYTQRQDFTGKTPNWLRCSICKVMCCALCSAQAPCCLQLKLTQPCSDCGCKYFPVASWLCMLADLQQAIQECC